MPKTPDYFHGKTIVITVTGHGLKDPKTAERQVPGVIEAAPTLGAVAIALGWT